MIGKPRRTSTSATLTALLLSFLGSSVPRAPFGPCNLDNHNHNAHGSIGSTAISTSTSCSFCVSAFTPASQLSTLPHSHRLPLPSHPHRPPPRPFANQYHPTTTTVTTLSLSSSPTSPTPTSPSSPLSQLLHDNGFGDRLVTLTPTTLSTQPVLAEIYEGGTWQLCLITDLVPPVPNQKKKKKKAKTNTKGMGQPKLQATLISLTSSPDTDTETSLTTKKNIGIDQITTIWQPLLNNLSLDDTIQSALSTNIEGSIQHDFAINFCEQAMQKLYHDRTVRTNNANAKGALTKKQIPKLAAKVEDSIKAEELLRTAMKAGPGMHRLVDSLDASNVLYSSKSEDFRTTLQRRLVSAEVLTSDARLGGRFKRMPCNLVAADVDVDISENEDEEDSVIIHSITILNGGWLAVDSGNRAGAEARKLVERSAANVDDNNNVNKDSSTQAQATTSSSPLLTAADERIVNRLECMAMGEEIDVADDSAAGRGNDNTRIEVDVREVLRAMKLPVSAAGAKDALIRMGRWTEQSTKSGNQNPVEPWPSNVLEAAASMVNFEKKRKQQLAQYAATKSKNGQTRLEGRTNLSAIPCVCVDAKGTAFRDDAIGVRPRSSTGRKVTDASKWEILLHISDVSDIFSPDLGECDVPYDTNALRQAAEKRGYSRYDLPLGPLHLMPPVALKALALEPAGQVANQGVVNRCVTLWAYIDEKTGKLVDAGLERSVTSAPIPFTYSSATSLLDGNVAPDNMSAEIQKARSILALAERNLSLWSEHQRETNEAAARRHERMKAKQIISDATSLLDGERGINKKFQYSRGHRIVDSALDLYGYALTNLLKRAKAPIPNAPGQGNNRRGRLGTAPLRRYVDAMAQRQALSALCNYGGPPLTKKECNIVYQAAAKAGDAIKTVRSRKKDKSAHGGGVISQRQGRANEQKALQRLESHLARIASDSGSKKQAVRALSTGRENEVVLEGIGLTVKCAGVDGTLKPGEKVLVHVVKLDPEKGQLRVNLASRARSR